MPVIRERGSMRVVMTVKNWATWLTRYEVSDRWVSKMPYHVCPSFLATSKYCVNQKIWFARHSGRLSKVISWRYALSWQSYAKISIIAFIVSEFFKWGKISQAPLKTDEKLWKLRKIPAGNGIIKLAMRV